MTPISFPAGEDRDDTHVVDGWELTSYVAVVHRLSQRFPHLRTVDIEAVVIREHEAFTGGRPIAVPVDVEAGAEEILSAEPGATD
ncbi:three-helix bundle dimerization domain-containing protein [Microbacterium caowuchunii]|uniref:Uncharacterized protein n=1 Tax=Microbacterium caowuchunii TaxID=2614638 RepID=A0A5N0T719_9MICO|nr:hypothetical protein [Microbacterium caowuchunii]KAA9130682.1 hypothetical protein F6B40_13725 [Microbacterium caowuchunii]